MSAYFGKALNKTQGNKMYDEKFFIVDIKCKISFRVGDIDDEEEGIFNRDSDFNEIADEIVRDLLQNNFDEIIVVKIVKELAAS